MFENTTSKNKSLANGFIGLFDCLTLAFMCSYLMLAKNWIWIEIVMTGLGVLAYMLIVLVVLESPKWLLVNGNTQLAIQSLNKIARINGSKKRISKHAQFIEGIIAKSYAAVMVANDTKPANSSVTLLNLQGDQTTSDADGASTNKSMLQSILTLPKRAIGGQM